MHGYHKLARVLALTLIGCGGDGALGGGGDYTAADIDAGALSGRIAGADWAMTEAQVSVSFFDDTALDFTLYAEDVDDCGLGIGSDLPIVLFGAPTVGADLALGLFAQTITLVEPPVTNNIATEGYLQVEVDGDTVDVGMIAEIDDDNYVNGRFTATICPDE